MTEDRLRYIAPQRYKALLFIRSEIEAGYAFPTNDAIAHHLGYKTSTSILDILNALVIAGFVERQFATQPSKKKYVYHLKQMEAAE